MLEILEPGFLTTVQDGGRIGWARYGVPPSGPMDRAAFKAANQLVGNATNTPALEITLTGPTFRLWRTGLIAICGATFEIGVGDLLVPPWHAVLVRAGQIVHLGQRRSGARAILAVSGGIAVPPYLGSASTYLRGTPTSPSGFGGFQGRALQAGDRLSLGLSPLASPALQAGRNWPDDARPPYTPHPTLRVVLGPQDDYFTSDAIATLLTSDYHVTAHADRMGFRLRGPRIRTKGATGIISDGIVTGSIQIPPDGQPIIMMVDHQTTGGYPKIATVIQADLPLLAQTLPNDPIRFRAIGISQAQKILNRDTH
jgi:antagonist of KipI